MGTTKVREPLISVGKRIRQLRKERGFSQMAFAAEIGLARAYYGGVERGERNIAVENLVRIAVGLGVEVGDLFPPVAELMGQGSQQSQQQQ